MYFSWTSVASSYSGQNQSTACFDCWPKCAQRGIFDWFLLSCLPPSTIQCFYQSKMVDSFWPVIVGLLTTCKVWQCLTFKCTTYTLASISTFLLILTLAVIGGLSTYTVSVNIGTWVRSSNFKAMSQVESLTSQGQVKSSWSPCLLLLYVVTILWYMYDHG